MIEIRELDKVNKIIISKIAYLHKKAFPQFFLTQLGVSFLKTLYQGYIEDSESGIIIVENKEQLTGFISYSKDYSRFYKELIKYHLIKFALCSAGAAIRHPSFIKRLFRAFKKSNEVARAEKYVELSSICVDPENEGQGFGTAMISYLVKLIDFSQYEYINLETDAEDNDKANRFYLCNDFKLSRQYITPEGRKMNEYRYKPGDVS